MKRAVAQRSMGDSFLNRLNSKCKGPDAGIELNFHGQREVIGGFKVGNRHFCFSFQKIIDWSSQVQVQSSPKSSFLLTYTLTGSKGWLKKLGTCYLCGRPAVSFQLLGIWGANQWIGGLSVHLSSSLSVFLSASQILKTIMMVLCKD